MRMSTENTHPQKRPPAPLCGGYSLRCGEFESSAFRAKTTWDFRVAKVCTRYANETNTAATQTAYFAGTGSIPEIASTRGAQTNCPRKSAADSSGKTVVTLLAPPFRLAMVFKYGMPIPLAKPSNAPAATIPPLPTPKERIANPKRKNAGGTYLTDCGDQRKIRPKKKPANAATISTPTMTSVMARIEKLLRAARAKLLTNAKNATVQRNMPTTLG